MKKVLSTLLCTALLLSLFGCGKAGNTLWKDASPGTSMLVLYRFDDEGGRGRNLADAGKEGKVLAELSAVKAVPVTDWTADKVTLPVYGIEIGSKDGWGIHAAWSNGYLILRDGSAYRYDFDFSGLEERYDWDYHRGVDSLSSMPCGQLLSLGKDGWIAEHLSPAEDPTPPEGISMTLKEQTAGKITVELNNHGNTEWMFGEHFSLQVLLDGAWYSVPVLDDKNYAFTDIGYMLPAGKTQEKSYSLGSYGSLPEGTYRLVTYGLSVEFDLPYTDKSILSITDQTVALDMDFPDVIEIFFEDENSQYCFGNPISQYIIVRYADGNEEDVKTALENGRAVISDLDRFGIRYYTESKA